MAIAARPGQIVWVRSRRWFSSGAYFDKMKSQSCANAPQTARKNVSALSGIKIEKIPVTITPMATWVFACDKSCHGRNLIRVLEDISVFNAGINLVFGF